MDEQIIIDTDPGVDDALAFVYSYNARLPVIAVSTVYGNASLQDVTRNAGYIIKSLGSNWKIYEGAEAPLSGKAYLAESHGVAGLGAVRPKDYEVAKSTGRSSFELFSALDKKAKSTILCLGPLTNVALALADPTIASYVERLVIMGGAFSEKGNVTDFAEFNVYNDPESFQKTIDQAMSRNIDTTIIPAEMCRKVQLTEQDLEALDRKMSLKALRQIVEPFINYYTTDETHGGYDGAVLYDVLVPLYYDHPELFKLTPSEVKVKLDDNTKRGQTIARAEPESPVKVCTGIYATEAKRVVMSTLARF